MSSHDQEVLRPRLDEAQKTLESALEEACSADVRDADTGELIRIEEVLAIANEAAKEAISVRRRLGVGKPPGAPGTEADPGGHASAHADPHADPHAGQNPGVANHARADAHRTFEDDAGVRWTAFAVYPSALTAGRASLRGTFQFGWLAFDSGGETRRLTPVPDNWRTLTDEGLRALCETAERSPRRTRGTRDTGPAGESQQPGG